jgi:rRNA biogenesis protein RRP5
MPQKRRLDDGSSAPKPKKTKVIASDKVDGKRPQLPSKLNAEEVDFPRGGGTSFTPIEVKAIRTEALQEANGELFEV